LMNYKSPTSKSFEKRSKIFFLSLFTVALSLIPFYLKLQQFKLIVEVTNAKVNDRLPKKRLGTCRLDEVLLKIYPYDPTSEFQELEIGLDLTFIQSEIKSVREIFSIKEM